ncbi:MAG: 16S rRNA processing protein RimM [Clostridia bacterium]|nr:16S rRNA processing protein RimM [Clostridia bacterium]
MKQTHLECGKIINTHGFRGTVKLESYCDAPEILADLPFIYFLNGTDYSAVKVLRASVFRQFVLMDLEGVTSEEAANKLRNTVVYAAREDLPLDEGDHFIVDLLGLPVKHAESGEILGKLVDIKTNGAVDLYVVRTEKGEYLVPAVPQFIPRIDSEDAVYVSPIPGLLDGGAENV